MIGLIDNMNYTTINVAGSKINTSQQDFLVQIGFAILGINFSRSVKSSQLSMVLSQLVAKNIPFSLKTNPPIYAQSPCQGCKR
jgi:hypothetical protein